MTSSASDVIAVSREMFGEFSRDRMNATSFYFVAKALARGGIASVHLHGLERFDRERFGGGGNDFDEKLDGFGKAAEGDGEEQGGTILGVGLAGPASAKARRMCACVFMVAL